MKVSSVIAGASAALVAFQAALYASHGEADLLRPPGAHGEKDFASRCVKCGKCMEACPYIAIKPARDDAGTAVGTPMIDARGMRPMRGTLRGQRAPGGHPHRKRRGAGGRHRALGMTSSAQLRRAPLNKLPNRWRFRT